ncbi:MAG: histidinol dehydrogenase, partial [Acidobacteriota bacterium]|nr:histidinol dehydrogenase [Acidobacteriota bacterium]
MTVQRSPSAFTIRIIGSADAAAVTALLDRSTLRNAALERRVARIVEHVRRDGDTALMEYARQFDGLAAPLEVSRDEIRRGARSVPREVRDAIRTAGEHIRRVAVRQVPAGWTMQPVAGVRIRQRVVPLDRVGCYVPGGRYPLPSSLLMTAIPARVAGVPEVVAVCPKVDATILCAAEATGVSRLFRVGGAHAIAALAFGTGSVPRVDKIVGPGNAYV